MRQRREGEAEAQAEARRQRQIQQALELIGPAPNAADACREHVGAAFSRAAGAFDVETLRHLGTKNANLHLRRLASALRRVLGVVNDIDQSFPLLGVEAFRYWPGMRRNDKGARLGGRAAFVVDLEKLTERVEELAAHRKLNVPGMKLWAALSARELLRKYSSAKIVTTKGGAFCKLAALLHGHPQADLQHACRQAKRIAEQRKKGEN